ncbi:MAG: hypothetical protein PHS57_05830 [Alphaproteobacteria bacterium]|nr:hypothetical protein [Alphaproteobacteria bacterium]
MALKRTEETIDITLLKHPERNVRIHGQKQISELVRSLKFAGQIKALVIDENNVVLAGNGLLDAMLESEYTEAWVLRVTGATENDKKKIMTMDNRIYSLGVDNHSVIEEFIKELSLDGELDIPGFDDSILATIAAEAEQVSKMIETFGVMSDEDKSRLDRAAERKEALLQRDADSPTPGETVQPSYADHARAEYAQVVHGEASGQEQTAPVGRFVICPKCGEKILI